MTDDDPPSFAERFRRERRHLTVLIVGKVRGAHGEYACVVSNVSRRGLKARFPHPLAVGERLTIVLRGLPEAPATVRWYDGAHGGVEFDAPIDVAAVLATFGAARMPRPPRFACTNATHFSCCGVSHAATLIDVSLGGAKLQPAATLGEVVGHAGTLVLPRVDQSRVGVIRWRGGNRIGFQFARPLPLDLLAALLSGAPGD